MQLVGCWTDWALTQMLKQGKEFMAFMLLERTVELLS
jgi:hypothetical protein